MSFEPMGGIKLAPSSQPFLVVTFHMECSGGGPEQGHSGVNGTNESSCKSILVVEDDEGIRETLKIFLEIEGYTVHAAINGKDGLDVLKKMSRPSLILLDLMMPVMNGWEFVEEMQKDDTLASIPVVIVSAYGDQAAAIKTQGVIKKPIDLDALLKVVQRWCGPPVKATT